MVDPANDIDMWTIQESTDFTTQPVPPIPPGYIGPSGYWVTTMAKVGTALKADYNGDGYNDLLLQDTANGQGAFWLMKDNVVSQGMLLSLNAGSRWQIAGTGDFYGDGNSDVVLVRDDGLIDIWRFSGTTFVSTEQLGVTMPAGYRIAAIADFNRDGNPDMVVVNDSTGDMLVWYFHGTTFQTGTAAHFVAQDGVTVIPEPAGWKVLGAGDFNQDGHQDLVLQNQSTSQIALWYFTDGMPAQDPNDHGVTLLGSDYVNGDASGYTVAAVADYSSDGLPDLMLQPPAGSGEQLALWVMSGPTVLAGYLITGDLGTDVVKGPR